MPSCDPLYRECRMEEIADLLNELINIGREPEVLRRDLCGLLK